MGYVGWDTVVNQANTQTGGAIGAVADVNTIQAVGAGVAGAGVVNTYSAAPPPPGILGFLLQEDGSYLLQESGDPPTRIELE